MYKICAPNEKSIYELSELAKEFIPETEFDIRCNDGSCDFDLYIPDLPSKFERGASLYSFLSRQTGIKQDWGILVGVRPKKLYTELVKKHGMQYAEQLLKNEYFLSDNKIILLRKTFFTQEKAVNISSPDGVGIYIGIPFCPTRCLYCSFTSNTINDEKAKRYLEALHKEIIAVSNILKRNKLFAESIYIGGGTPTSLNNEDFDKLLSWVQEELLCRKTVEYTVECGRPDTINEFKLKAINRRGAGRISINPQTMKDETLRLIGRQHSCEQIRESYSLARNAGSYIINMDLIAGLPGESFGDFRKSIDEIVELNPENITVHTLAVKKASRLIEQDSEYNYRHAGTVRMMLDYASEKLSKSAYSPYYLYRQKHMTGNFENVGYCRDGYASLYNIRIMEENQSIIALGAGGITKIYYPKENRLERIPNVSNYEIYIERIEEMIERKTKLMLNEGKI